MSLFKREILDEFGEVRDRLAVNLPDLERDLKAALGEPGDHLHAFSYRLKSEASLREKLARPDRTYDTLFDVTDLVGFRLVTAFESSIPEIARQIETHYAIDLTNSRNHLRHDDHERFGYRSLHYICPFPRTLGFPPEARFEIQVRTALQDAWAEIEHDLGYKASDLAPSKLRRRFSRVASLLEIADEELVAIRGELRAYIEATKDHSPLDLISLKELVRHESVRDLDFAIGRLLGVEVERREFYPDYLLHALRLSGLSTTQDTLAAVREARPLFDTFVPIYFKFAKRALGFDAAGMQSVPRGYALLFLAHAQLFAHEPLAVNRLKYFTKFYAQLDFPDDPARAHAVGKALVESLEGISV